MSIIKHFGTNLFNSGNIYKYINDIFKRLNILEKNPSGDGNGVYDGSGTSPFKTLVTVTENIDSSVSEFAIGKYPSWPEVNLQSGERGFYYSLGYLDAIGINNGTNYVHATGSGVRLNAGTRSLRLNNGFDGFQLSGANFLLVRVGTGDPNGVVTANIGSLFLRTDGGAGTTLYVKETGTGNTGWVAK